MKFYGIDVTDLSARQINKLFRANDESYKFPICGKFNATERAIRRLRKYSRQGAYIPNGGSEYAYALDSEISEIVNSIL